ncbi:hypothetical protein THAOC_18864 [Thalassiosira oceanica]|uniref:Endonuclease/exonuclease/phosphatase domain-containing protein n=1 Tax=Thalassiosira oceanica TaxID=159749 RepID=K0SIA8_THAOC|nr:hypothetical protein THAOC_18864 [Thalassiosira oceanica]|eukprot:EJK60731.1 hypothetical protein THAOC_18864 [Thalassiosira oceanica]
MTLLSLTSAIMASVDALRFVSLGGGDAAMTKSRNSVRVVSFNALADQYLHYQERSRPNSSWAVFDKKRRHWLLGQVFQRFVDEGVDFICLQEIDFKIARQVLADNNGYTRLLTPTGYGQGDQRRPDTANGRGGTRVDACCIFFSREWELVGNEMIVNLDSLAGDRSTKFGRTFKRGNFGIIARLRSVFSGREVLVCNCHLFWDPKFEYVKLAQVHYMCLKVQEELECSSCPVIFCGDLNSQPGSLVHEYLSTGQLFRSAELKKLRLRQVAKGLNEKVQEWLAGEETSSTSVLENPIRHLLLESAYSSLGHGYMQEEIELTNKTADFSGVIDYIFSSSASMAQTGRLHVPKVQSALPTKKWPSDHLALGAELFFDD